MEIKFDYEYDIREQGWNLLFIRENTARAIFVKEAASTFDVLAAIKRTLDSI